MRKIVGDILQLTGNVTHYCVRRPYAKFFLKEVDTIQSDGGFVLDEIKRRPIKTWTVRDQDTSLIGMNPPESCQTIPVRSPPATEVPFQRVRDILQTSRDDFEQPMSGHFVALNGAQIPQTV